MRGRLAGACLLVAAAALVAGCTPSARAGHDAQALSRDAAAPLESSHGRIALSPAERQAAALGGLLPANTRSILQVDRRLHYGEFVWNDQGVPPGDVVVAVDLRTQILSVFRAGHEIGTTVILYGADGHDTPIGTHPVRSKARDYRSVAYDAPMPFALWLTDDGVAIHGSDVRRGRATHGCIGVPTEFAERLFGVVRPGDPVIVARSHEPAPPSIAT